MAESAPEKPAPKKRGRKPILDPELVAAALVETSGNIMAVARKFEVHRSSVQELIDKRPSLQRVLKDSREGVLDEAESMLYAAVRNGQAWAICFFLKTQGKSRGYVERQEVSADAAAGALLRGLIGDRIAKRVGGAGGETGDAGGAGGGGHAPHVATPEAPRTD